MDSEIKEEIPVHEEFILCCGVETQVLKCGPWTDLLNDQSGNRPKLLIFIITGKFKNPFEETFYGYLELFLILKEIGKYKNLMGENKIIKTMDK